jgi:hypothetical protein
MMSHRTQVALRTASLALVSVLALAWTAPALAADVICVPNAAIDGSCTTSAGTINGAIALASLGGGDTVLVGDGAYSEFVTIDRDVALLSLNGRAATSISPPTSPAAALGTIKVTGGTTAVQIGALGQGFTINGVDNTSAGLESAAVYFQGSHSNAQVIDNEIVAAGDHGLLTEFGATISGFVIDSNEFSGQTFVGSPAGYGFGLQFSLANVPRQLCAIGGGSGGGSTSNTTFTNNVISGVSGGINPDLTGTQCPHAGLTCEQGNTSVTIDSVGATITGNVFMSTTSRFATALRARGPGTTISGNTFDSTGIAPSAAGHVFVQNTGEDVATVAANNTFDKGVYVAGAIGTIGISVGSAMAVVPSGTTIHVLAGTYDEPPLLLYDGTTAPMQVVVAANQTVLGAGKTTTIIKPTGNTSNSGDPRGWFLVNTGVSLDMSDMTFDGTGRKIYQAFRHRGSGSFTNVLFNEIKYNESGADYAGTAIVAFGTGPVDVADSMFMEIGRVGVLYFALGGTSSFSGNSYVGKGTGDFLDYMLDISAGANVSVDGNTVSGNRGVASSDGSTSAGILVTTYFGAGTTASITGNVIEDNTSGIARGYDSADTSTIDASCNRIAGNDTGLQIVGTSGGSVMANTNSISGNTAGIDASTLVAGTVDAEDNWWGASDGPSGAGPGSGDTISANVDAIPFATSVPGCVNCSTDAQCNDGLVCNGPEVCTAGMCGPGTPPDCSSLDDQCNVGICVEPTGCVPDPVVDGTGCDATLDSCSLPDTCQAGVCTDGGGGDTDADNFCDADDNCPADFNPGQEDLDGDGLGDVCDPDDGPLNVTLVTLRRAKTGKDNGSVKVKGDFNTLPPADVFTAADGITMTVQDALGFVTTYTWPTAECLTKSTGRVKCKSLDRRFLGTFKPFAKTPGVFRYVVRFKKLVTAPDLVFSGPVTARLSYGPAPTDRVGDISDCRATSSGLKCRAF